MSTAECPRCGWNLAGAAATTRLLPHAAHDAVLSTDEIQLLEDQVRRLDEEISRLNKDRVSILHRINSVRPTTRRLPPEILSTIFQFVSPPFDFIPSFSSDIFRREEASCISDEMFQVDIAAVSCVWRQVAISTPQLWTSLALGIHQSFNNANLSTLNNFLQNALHFPMSIELDFRDQTSAWSEVRAESLLLMEPIKNAIFVDHVDRIRSLRLIGSPYEWFPQFKNLSRCDTLVVIWPSYDEDEDLPPDGHIDLTELPCLRHVVFAHPRYSFSLERSRITTLHLWWVPCDICFEFLTTCPRLIEFESYHPLCEQRDGVAIPLIKQPIMMEKIENLTWSNRYLPASSPILRRLNDLRFSKIRTLQWSDDDFDDFPSGASYCLELFSNLPTTLSSLILNRSCYPPHLPDMEEMLRPIPHLRELHFVDCKVECVEAVINAIGRPFVRHPENEQREASPELSLPRDRIFLPHLSKLSLTEKTSPTPELDGRIFVDMLEALQTSRTGPIQFQLTISHQNISWSTDTLDRMRALVASGFSVEIIEESGPLNLS